jgi:hypothetical protein
MTRLANLTTRNFLIATYDALATTFAALASFLLRFCDELPDLYPSWSVIFRGYVLQNAK